MLLAVVGTGLGLYLISSRWLSPERVDIALASTGKDLRRHARVGATPQAMDTEGRHRPSLCS
jgi:hypothetical protein